MQTATMLALAACVVLAVAKPTDVLPKAEGVGDSGEPVVAPETAAFLAGLGSQEVPLSKLIQPGSGQCAVTCKFFYHKIGGYCKYSPGHNSDTCGKDQVCVCYN